MVGFGGVGFFQHLSENWIVGRLYLRASIGEIKQDYDNSQKVAAEWESLALVVSQLGKTLPIHMIPCWAFGEIMILLF